MKTWLGSIVLLLSLAVTAQEPWPRFRAGANLVSVDAYFSKDGKPITDLKRAEIEIFEDDNPQKVEGFRLVHSRGQGSARAKPGPAVVAGIRGPTAEPGARIFAVFLDTWHAGLEGSARAAAPVSELLNRIVGANDLVGLVTPDLPARDLLLTHRTEAIERMTRETIAWSQRDRINTADPREAEYLLCYPDNDSKHPQLRGVAKEMIERRREQKTLRALDELIAHLGTLSDERKFIVLLSEGWVVFRQDEALAAVLEKAAPATPPPPGQGAARSPGGTATMSAYDRGFAACERERAMLAFVDHSVEIRQLAQRANRANATFYIVDPRGLALSDDTIATTRPTTPGEDRSRMSARQGAVRELALNTDGAAVLNSSDMRGGLARMMADAGSYYLMQYYSTNAKLDGRFRQVSVRVKRPGIQVRARPGYLAPTEAEAGAAGVPVTPLAMPPGVERIARRPEIVALRRGPSTGLNYVAAGEPRFRRTERLRIEVAMPANATGAAGRVLTAQSQTTPLIVSYSTQEASGQLIGIAEVPLAPLAVGPYQLELSYEVMGQRESVTYAFRIIP